VVKWRRHQLFRNLRGALFGLLRLLKQSGHLAAVIEIDLGSGHRIRVDGDVDGDALRRVLDALVRR